MLPELLRLAILGLAALSGQDPQPAPSAAGQEGPKFSIEQDQHAARGFGADAARIDSQITLRIPEEQADAVYEYLKAKYVGQDHILADQFPGIRLNGQKMSDVSIFTDEYYDSPNLDLYKTKNSVRHRTRLNTTNPDDRKSGRELVQIKVTPPGKFELRSEVKYKVAEPEQRDRTKEPHPLIGLIDKDLRADFKKTFTEAGIEPYSLRHVFTITQTRRRGYLNWDDQNIFSFSVDQGSAGILWAKGRYASVDMGLVEIVYTESDAAKREKIWSIREAIIADLKAHFPGLEQTTDSKYTIVFNQIKGKLPGAELLVRLGLNDEKGSQVLIVVVALIAVGGFLAVRGIRLRLRRRTAQSVQPAT